jgi:cytoskeleton protein RodZ
MGSFGERLQREREMRSISLDEIADSTKISTRFLRALETEDFKKLPGGIFNKGFVRAYAKYLGIDEEQAVTDFVAAENGAQKPEKFPVVDPNQPSLFTPTSNSHVSAKGSSVNIYAAAATRSKADEVESQPDQAAGFVTFAVILVIVLGVGGFAWKFFSERSAAHANSASQPAVTQSLSVSTNSVAPPPVTVPSAASPQGTSGLGAKLEMAKSETAKNGPKQEEGSSQLALSTTSLENVVKKQDDGKAGDAAVVSDKPVRLNLRMKSESWVSVKADGKLQWEGVLQASSFRTFKAAKEIVVKLGNAPGVEVSYNGKNLPAFTDDSKTKTLTINQDGLVQQ